MILVVLTRFLALPAPSNTQRVQMSSREHPHLTDLSQLAYLVVDEADRMIKQGSFPQLTKIFESINEANPPLTDDLSDAEDDDDDDDGDSERLRGLQGIPGEAKVTMLDDRLLEMIRKQEANSASSSDAREGLAPEPQELDDSEFLEEQKRLDAEIERDLEADGDADDDELPVHRQTFVYSATLMLDPSSRRLIKAVEAKALPSKTKKKKGKRAAQSVEGAIAEILEKAGARGETKVVDLTTSNSDKTKRKGSNNSAKSASSVTTRLPPGLSLRQVKCTQLHKDMYLYAFLTTTKAGSSGPCLVFCNSIAAVRRVGDTLKLLGLPVRQLHAKMAQVCLKLGVLSLRNGHEDRQTISRADLYFTYRLQLSSKTEASWGY